VNFTEGKSLSLTDKWAFKRNRLQRGLSINDDFSLEGRRGNKNFLGKAASRRRPGDQVDVVGREVKSKESANRRTSNDEKSASGRWGFIEKRESRFGKRGWLIGRGCPGQRGVYLKKKGFQKRRSPGQGGGIFRNLAPGKGSGIRPKSGMASRAGGKGGFKKKKGKGSGPGEAKPGRKGKEIRNNGGREISGGSCNARLQKRKLERLGALLPRIQVRGGEGGDQRAGGGQSNLKEYYFEGGQYSRGKGRDALLKTVGERVSSRCEKRSLLPPESFSCLKREGGCRAREYVSPFGGEGA